MCEIYCVGFQNDWQPKPNQPLGVRESTISAPWRRFHFVHVGNEAIIPINLTSESRRRSLFGEEDLSWRKYDHRAGWKVAQDLRGDTAGTSAVQERFPPKPNPIGERFWPSRHPPKEFWPGKLSRLCRLGPSEGKAAPKGPSVRNEGIGHRGTKGGWTRELGSSSAPLQDHRSGDCKEGSQKKQWPNDCSLDAKVIGMANSNVSVEASNDGRIMTWRGGSLRTGDVRIGRAAFGLSQAMPLPAG